MTRENSSSAGFVARAASATALVAIIAGGLWVLLHWGRLDGWASVSWRDIWSQPDDGRLLLGVLTVVGWLAWVLVVGTVACEAIAALSRGRLRPRMPGSGWLRPAIAGLVITVFGLSAVTALMGHQPLGAAVGGMDEASHQDTPASVWQADGSTETSASLASVGKTAPYVVQPGDDLWSLAEQFAGGGENWRVIAEANDTAVLDPGVELTPGTMLMVPLASPQAGNTSATLLRATAPAKIDEGASGDSPDAATVTVQPGDTLWDLSKSKLGDAYRWPEIYDANRAVIADPDLIYPGQTLKVPSSSGSADAPSDADDTGVPAGDVPQTETPDETPDGTDQQLAAVFSHAAQIGAAAGEVTAATVTAPSGPHESLSDEAQSPDSMIAALLGSIGVGLAAALIAGIGANRLMQLRERAVGRALPRLTPSVQEFETALDKRARILLSRTDDDETWVRPIVAQRELDEDDADESANVGETESAVQPVIQPLIARGPALSLVADEGIVLVEGLVCLGAGVSDEGVSLDLLDAGLVQVLGSESQVIGLIAAMVGQVFAKPAETRPEVMLAVSKLDWLAALLDCPLMPSEIAESLVSQRLAAPGVATEQLVVFTDGHMPAVEKGCGITVVSGWCRDRQPGADVAIEVDDTDTARLWQATSGFGMASSPVAAVFRAQLVSAPARRVLAELADTVTSLDFPQAAWWASNGDATPGKVWVAGSAPDAVAGIDVDEDVASDDPPTQPFLRLFGPVMLMGARGVAPSQATKQCLEYCGWLLRNPGQTSTAMARSLLVAEATRRSNMSRLRLWLGCDDAGEPYLPDAYSGRIMLHAGVTSDWDRMNVLVGGVNRASEHSLIDALRLVRGAPLADAAPGQWRWAEEWRCDMVSLARDTAAILCNRALARDDVELARWAVNRGLLAAPDDVVLLTAQVRVEMLAGDRAEVERLALSLTRQASRAGFDLPEETAALLQEALEGSRRTRLAA